ncbi:MAG: NADP-dependent phosphogluconate dehydrogenase [Alphaproteobacteria bacterium]|nr:NADP-dependent phosphogluconate dehydrogenase [Alphaproteobacteria bacterium]
MTAAALGLVGVGTMGRALAANLADRGHAVAVFDQDLSRAQSLQRESRLIVAAADLDALVAKLERPRSVLLMVNAGKPVDAVLDALAPLLGRGDAVLDGGNSHYRDTARRAEALQARGIDYLGVGISGGEEGARHGASIMVGGARAAYDRARPLLDSIAARADGVACLGWFGGAGAGHFVKMVHNGIEYAVMQLIAEAWVAMERLLGLGLAECAAQVASWLDGPMRSYLLEITAELLRRRDPLTGQPVLQVISDRAGQKGTGQWTTEAALALGVPAPTLAEAVVARHLSALDAARREIAAARPAQLPSARPADTAIAIAPALDAATLIAYAQGFALIAAAAREYAWQTDLAAVARVWRAGCIVRADCLAAIAEAWRADPAPPSLLLSPPIAQRIARGVGDLRRLVATGALQGVAMPAMASALAWYDAYGDTRLWTVLVQAQRDRFGQHGFERLDRPGKFHLDGGQA